METMSGYILGHAEAVSVGMCLDILYSVRKGWLPAAEAERIISVLKTLELPVFHPPCFPAGQKTAPAKC